MAISRLARQAILLALVLLCVATGALLFAPLGWPFELFSHFRPQLAASAVLLAVALALLREPRACLLAGALGAFLFLPDARGLVAAEPAATCSGQSFTFATVNLQYSNRDPQRLLAWLAAEQPDVVVFQEVTPAWARALAGAHLYPHGRMLTRTDPYGVALLSRLPIVRIDAVDLAGDGLPSLDARLALQGGELHVLGLHTRWPITPQLAALRNAALVRAARRVHALDRPTIAAGDLNLSPDSPEFARLLRRSGLRDVFAGRGWHPTWMAGFWPLALRIDHQLASPALCVERVKVGPEFGSDHRPVIAKYRWPAPTRG